MHQLHYGSVKTETLESKITLFEHNGELLVRQVIQEANGKVVSIKVIELNSVDVFVTTYDDTMIPEPVLIFLQELGYKILSKVGF